MLGLSALSADSLLGIGRELSGGFNPPEGNYHSALECYDLAFEKAPANPMDAANCLRYSAFICQHKLPKTRENFYRAVNYYERTCTFVSAENVQESLYVPEKDLLFLLYAPEIYGFAAGLACSDDRKLLSLVDTIISRNTPIVASPPKAVEFPNKDEVDYSLVVNIIHSAKSWMVDVLLVKHALCNQPLLEGTVAWDITHTLLSRAIDVKHPELTKSMLALYGWFYHYCVLKTPDSFDKAVRYYEEAILVPTEIKNASSLAFIHYIELLSFPKEYGFLHSPDTSRLETLKSEQESFRDLHLGNVCARQMEILVGMDCFGTGTFPILEPKERHLDAALELGERILADSSCLLIFKVYALLMMGIVSISRDQSTGRSPRRQALECFTQALRLDPFAEEASLLVDDSRCDLKRQDLRILKDQNTGRITVMADGILKHILPLLFSPADVDSQERRALLEDVKSLFEPANREILLFPGKAKQAFSWYTKMRDSFGGIRDETLQSRKQALLSKYNLHWEAKAAFEKELEDVKSDDNLLEEWKIHLGGYLNSRISSYAGKGTLSIS